MNIQKNKISSINSFARKVAILSFLVGSFLFLFFSLSNFAPILYLGFIYVVFAVPINGLVFLIVLSSCFQENCKNKEFHKTIIIMLLDIPIAVLYFFLVVGAPVLHI